MNSSNVNCLQFLSRLSDLQRQITQFGYKTELLRSVFSNQTVSLKKRSLWQSRANNFSIEPFSIQIEIFQNKLISNN